MHEKLLYDILDLDKSRYEWSEEFRCGKESKIVSERKYMKNSPSRTHIIHKLFNSESFLHSSKCGFCFSLKPLGKNKSKQFFFLNEQIPQYFSAKYFTTEPRASPLIIPTMKSLVTTVCWFEKFQIHSEQDWTTFTKLVKFSIISSFNRLAREKRK